MNVIVYVMDALRKDFVGCYGHEQDTTPNLDAFAEDAVRYENAYSTATWTKAAAASILSSRHPRALNMLHHMDAMPDLEYLLPKFLDARGFRTHAVSANNFVSEEFGFRGFDEFTLLQRDDAVQERRRKAKEPRGKEPEIMDRLGIDEIVTPLSEDVNEAVFDVLDDSSDDEDEFVLAWSIDTHGPYFLRGEESHFGNSPEDMIFEDEVTAENMDEVRSLYRDMIRYNDRQFGELVEKLRADGEYEDTLLIVAADHGESFGDHTSYFDIPIIGHNGVVYEEVVRVPLLIKYPGGDHGGETVEGLAQLLDLYPTIADVCGAEPPPVTEGRSLVPPAADRLDGRTLFLESHPLPDRVYSGAVRRGDRKLVRIENYLRPTTDWRLLADTLLWKYAVPTNQLFDLSVDPGERTDRSGAEADAARELSAAFDAERDRLDEAATEMADRELDDLADDTRRHLRAIGYLE